MSQELEIRIKAWQDKANALQREIQAAYGNLDQRLYRLRLAETGLIAEWDQIQADISREKFLESKGTQNAKTT